MELREPKSDRVRRLAVVGVAVLVAVALGFVYLRISEWRRAPSCAAAYATASTANDTALVDAQRSGATMGRGELGIRVGATFDMPLAAVLDREGKVVWQGQAVTDWAEVQRAALAVAPGDGGTE